MRKLGTFGLWMALLGSFQPGQKQAISGGERCLLPVHRSRPLPNLKLDDQQCQESGQSQRTSCQHLASNNMSRS